MDGMPTSPEPFEELIRDSVYSVKNAFDASVWTADELYDVLIRAAKLDTETLRHIAREVGITFDEPTTVDKEEYLLILNEADDKEKLKRRLTEKGV